MPSEDSWRGGVSVGQMGGWAMNRGTGRGGAAVGRMPGLGAVGAGALGSGSLGLGSLGLGSLGAGALGSGAWAHRWSVGRGSGPLGAHPGFRDRARLGRARWAQRPGLVGPAGPRARKRSPGCTVARDSAPGLAGARVAGLSGLGPRGPSGAEAVPRAYRAPDSRLGLASAGLAGPSAWVCRAQSQFLRAPTPGRRGPRAAGSGTHGGLALGLEPWRGPQAVPPCSVPGLARPVGPLVVRASGFVGPAGAVRRGPGRRSSARARRTPRSRRRGSGSPGRSHRSHRGWSRGRRRSGRSGPRVPVRPR